VSLPGDAARLVHRELARQAVQESLVLLKNNNNILPLAREQKILVVGGMPTVYPIKPAAGR
jgi:beta-glucosidase-like glycosyl hydrolase